MTGSGVGRFLSYLAPHRSRFAQACAAMVAVAGFNGAAIYLLKPIVNEIFVSRDFAMLWLAILAAPALIGMKAAASYAQNYLMSWIGQRVSRTLRDELFGHLHALGLDFHAERRTGEVLSRVTNDLNTVQSALTTVPLYLIRDSLTVLVLTGVLFWLNARFAVLALAAVPAATLVLLVLGRKMRQASLESQAVMGLIYSRFQESLQGMLVIKAFNYEAGAAGRFEVENERYFEQMMRYLRATALAGPLMEFTGSLVLAALVYLGGREIISGRMTTGDFFAFLGAFFAAYAPLKNLARLNSELQRGLASGERIFQLLDERPSIAPAPGAPRFQRLKSSLRLEGVTFRYPGRERAALQSLDLEVKRGEVVGIVGPSGSGKTTLIQLLLRLYDPQEGRVLYDGKDLKALDLASVRDALGLVTQETVLFNDTVSANIALGRIGARRASIESAARAAGAADFISELPQGYETVVGDRGARLSGGQRQRIAIARALLKDPSVLLLDEATSALDAASEAAVARGLAALMAGRTALVVAHRLSTVQGADRIVVLHHGRKAQEGSHERLLAAGGLYRRLYDIQKAHPPVLLGAGAP